MSEANTSRRQVLRILISLPMVSAVGWESGILQAAAQASSLSPEESLKKLILLLGPWHASDKGDAEDFAKRFLAAEHAGGQYLPESSELVQTLASRFPETMAMKQIDLRNLPSKERELLLQLVRQLYSLIEVRFIAANEPPWGECQGDPTRHTRAPA